MKSEDIKILKELSQDVADLMPRGLMADASGRFYIKGGKIKTMDLLELIEISRDRVLKLNAAIQQIEDRKSSKDNNKHPPPLPLPPDDNVQEYNNPPPPPPDPVPDYVKESKPIKP